MSTSAICLPTYCMIGVGAIFALVTLFMIRYPV